MLARAYDEGTSFFGRNSDHAHNAMVMKLMLEKSDSISMYCGEMSVFRKKFYDIIRQKDAETGNKIETLMAQALEAFCSKEKAEIKIILPHFDSSYLNDLIVDKNDFLRVAQIAALPTIPDAGFQESVRQLNHFSFTHDRRISRIEIEEDKHAALLMIGDEPAITDFPVKIFKTLSRSASPICLN